MKSKNTTPSKTDATRPSITSIPPIVTPDKKLIERGRVATPKDAKTIYETLYSEDRNSSAQRYQYQQALDGHPPISPDELKRRGMTGATNINWNLMSQSQEEAEAPYNDVLESIDRFCSLPTGFGDDSQRAIWQPIMEEEFTRSLKKWEEFQPLWQSNARMFVAEGVSFAFREDSRDWRWKIVGQQHIKFPRASRANVNELDCVAAKVLTRPSHLYKILLRGKAAEKEGWNFKEIKDALIATTQQDPTQGDDWIALEKRWKNNDISQSAKAQTVPLIHLWVQELDGTATRLLSRLDGEGDFLYKSEGNMKSMSECLIAFCYGVGTNGDFHSIRGLAAKTFSPACGINRVLNKFIDMACHVSTPHLQAASEDGITDLMIKPVGPYAVLDSNTTPVEVKVPPFDTTLIPVLNELKGLMAGKTAQYTSGITNQIDRTQRTATEQKMRYAQQGKLSTSGMNLFFSSWERLLKQTVRAMIRPDYQQNEGGGDLVVELRNRLVKRGVPLEAFYQIDVDAIEVNTGTGKGSAQERMVALDGVGQSYPDMDAFAKNIYNRERVSAYWGASKAELMFPQQPGLRPPAEAGMASMENRLMALDGKAIPVEPNQDHFTHLTKHMPFLLDLNTAIEQQQMQMAEAIPQMTPVWEHANQHLELLPPNNPHRGEIKQALSQLGEVIINEGKKLEAERQRQMEEQGGQQPDASPNDLIQVAQAQAKLQAMQLEGEYDAAKKQRELEHNDRKAAQQIAITAAKHAVEMRKAARTMVTRPKK